MYITTLKLANPTDKIEVIDTCTIKITSQERQSIDLTDKEIRPRFFINPKDGFCNKIILLELNPNGLWYYYNYKLKRKENYTQFSTGQLNHYLETKTWLEITY
jgi:hypothetical protein